MKDHLKRVMEKTGASTRAGLIARVAGCLHPSLASRLNGSRRSKRTSLAT